MQTKRFSALALVTSLSFGCLGQVQPSAGADTVTEPGAPPSGGGAPGYGYSNADAGTGGATTPTSRGDAGSLGTPPASPSIDAATSVPPSFDAGTPDASGDPGSGAGGTWDGGTPNGGSLLAAGWTGHAEYVYDVSPATGAIMPLGALGSLQTWSDQLVVDTAEAHVFAVGLTPSNVPKVYSLDVTTGQSTEAVIDSENTSLAGVTDAGQLVALIWTGTEEGVFLLNPTSGAATQVGALAGLKVWSNQSAFDHAAHVVYAIGQDSANATSLYSFSLDTLTQGPTSPVSSALVNPALGGVLPNGSPLAAFWDGTVEWVAQLAPASGEATKIGQLGDLYLWSSNMVLTPAGGSVYATGSDHANAERLYSMTVASASTIVGEASVAPLTLAKY